MLTKVSYHNVQNPLRPEIPYPEIAYQRQSARGVEHRLDKRNQNADDRLMSVTARQSARNTDPSSIREFFSQEKKVYS